MLMKKTGFIAALLFSCAAGSCLVQAEETELFTETETEKQESTLPAFEYNGNNAILACVCEYLNEIGDWYLSADVMIPAPAVFEINTDDPEDIRVYGNFSVYWYSLEDEVLTAESGGLLPGVFHLKSSGDGYEVTEFDRATDGTGYDEDMERFAAESGIDYVRGLYFRQSGLETDPEEYVRAVFIEQYIAENNLAIKAYGDFGWDPVELSPLKLVCREGTLYRDTGELAYWQSEEEEFSIAGADTDIPEEEGTSNFGDCQGRTGVRENTIELNFGGVWHIFEPCPMPGSDPDADESAMTAKMAEYSEEEALGSRAELTLESNPTTGFDWSVSQSDEIFDIQSEFVSDDPEGTLSGAGGMTRFTFVPLKAGTAEVTFSYERSWEKDPIMVRTYTFEVDEELNIKLTNAAVTGQDGGNMEVEIVLPETPEQ